MIQSPHSHTIKKEVNLISVLQETNTLLKEGDLLLLVILLSVALLALVTVFFIPSLDSKIWEKTIYTEVVITHAVGKAISCRLKEDSSGEVRGTVVDSYDNGRQTEVRFEKFTDGKNIEYNVSHLRNIKINIDSKGRLKITIWLHKTAGCPEELELVQEFLESSIKIYEVSKTYALGQDLEVSNLVKWILQTVQKHKP